MVVSSFWRFLITGSISSQQSHFAPFLLRFLFFARWDFFFTNFVSLSFQFFRIPPSNFEYLFTPNTYAILSTENKCH